MHAKAKMQVGSEPIGFSKMAVIAVFVPFHRPVTLVHHLEDHEVFLPTLEKAEGNGRCKG
jgi:hypothetical protein